MIQSEELNNFVENISAPLREAVQRELFTNILVSKNDTIQDVYKIIIDQ